MNFGYGGLKLREDSCKILWKRKLERWINYEWKVPQIVWLRGIYRVVGDLDEKSFLDSKLSFVCSLQLRRLLICCSLSSRRITEVAAYVPFIQTWCSGRNWALVTNPSATELLQWWALPFVPRQGYFGNFVSQISFQCQQREFFSSWSPRYLH